MKRVIMVFVMIVLLAGVFGQSMVSAKAAESERPEVSRYYTSICIRDGESLWSIASRYKENSPLSTSEYIAELKRMNGLDKEMIHSGQYLTVVYFE